MLSSSNMFNSTFKAVSQGGWVNSTVTPLVFSQPLIIALSSITSPIHSPISRDKPPLAHPGYVHLQQCLNPIPPNLQSGSRRQFSSTSWFQPPQCQPPSTRPPSAHPKYPLGSTLHIFFCIYRALLSMEKHYPLLFLPSFGDIQASAKLLPHFPLYPFHVQVLHHLASFLPAFFIQHRQSHPSPSSSDALLPVSPSLPDKSSLPCCFPRPVGFHILQEILTSPCGHTAPPFSTTRTHGGLEGATGGTLATSEN